MDEKNDGWMSLGRVSTEALASVEESHAALYTRAEESVIEACAKMRKSIADLELQMLSKLSQLQCEQAVILRTSQPTPSAAGEFYENVRKIERALDPLTAHADNLSHIKLTIARCAGLVSAEGSLAKLVVSSGRSRNTGATMPSIQFAHLMPAAASLAPRSVDQSYTPYPASPAYEPQAQLQPQPTSGNTARKSSTCFVFYLPLMTNDELAHLFSTYGTVLNAYVAMDKNTGQSRGYGFVGFSTPEEAQAAVKGLNKYPIGNKFLSVSIKI